MVRDCCDRARGTNVMDARAQTLANFQNVLINDFPRKFFILRTRSPTQTSQCVRYCNASPAGKFWRNPSLQRAPDARGNQAAEKVVFLSFRAVRGISLRCKPMKKRGIPRSARN